MDYFDIDYFLKKKEVMNLNWKTFYTKIILQLIYKLKISLQKLP